MQPTQKKYFLKIFLFGIGFIFSLSIIGSITLFAAQNFNLYDLGVFLIASGLIIAAITGYINYSSSSWKIRFQNSLPLEVRDQGVRDSFKDLLNTILLSSLLAAVLGFLLIWNQNQQGIRSSDDAATPQVSLLKGELELYYPKSIQWYEDAYLIDATVYIGRSSYSDLITATFLSYEEPTRQLILTTENNGNIVRRFYDANPDRTYWPIVDSDWPLDSQDAVNIFSENSDIRFCLNITLDETRYYEKAQLKLKRKYSNLENPVMWELWLPSRCPNVEMRYFMNASTGDLIDFEY